MINNKPFATPILFLIFNRPNPTQQVFDAIKKAQPRQLFIASDGPRENKNGETELCEATMTIITQVDCDCEIYTNYLVKKSL